MNAVTPAELGARITKEVNDNGCLTDYAEVMLAQLQQQAERSAKDRRDALTESLERIESILDSDRGGEPFARGQCITIARAALAAVPANQTDTP